MSRPLLPDEVWARIEPMLPASKPRRARYPGRKPIDPRKVLTGVLLVLRSGIPWEELPVEMDCGCGMTCVNYLRAWQQSGAWANIYEVLLGHLPDADKLDWSRVPCEGPLGLATSNDAQVRARRAALRRRRRALAGPREASPG
jgi:transposase